MLKDINVAATVAVRSLEVGKLADLVVLDRNPLDNIRDTTAIRYTVINGRVYDSNMDEVGGEARAPFWFEEEDGEAFSPSMTLTHGHAHTHGHD